MPRGRLPCRSCRHRQSCAGRRRRRARAARRRRGAGSALLDQAALDAVLDVGQLHAAVADRAAAEAVQQVRAPAHLVGDLHRVAGEQAGIPALVGDEPDVRRNLGVALDEAHSRGQAGGEPAGGEHGDGPHSHGPTLPVRPAPCQSRPSGQRMAMTAPRAPSAGPPAAARSAGTRTRGAGPLVDVQEDRRAPAGRARLVVPDDLRVVVGRLVEQLLGTGPPAVRRGALVGVVERRGESSTHTSWASTCSHEPTLRPGLA